ncbi:MAG: AAA family ATPase [Clostridia bacterium]|nr:AAA family ATPase [Clostridia bacterium]
MTTSAFDRVIGYESVKKELKLLCDVWKNSGKYERLGGKPPHGLLLHGDPGLGKTLFATCLIEECGLPSITVRKDRANGAFLDELRLAFDEAKEKAPAILLLDDLDKFTNDVSENNRDADEYVTVQTEMDATANCGVFVVATVNDRWKLPESLLRAGRFDVEIELATPSLKDTEKIIRHYLAGKGFDLDQADLKEFAGIMVENSCADIESVVNQATIYAVYDGRDRVTKDDLIRACLRKFFNAPEGGDSYSALTRSQTAYHEAAHAIVADVLEPGSVNLISIKATDGKVGGTVSFRNDPDYFHRMIYQENRVRAILAGKAVTEMVFGEIDVGSKSDVNRAIRVVERFRDDFSAYGFANIVHQWTPEAVKADAHRRMTEILEDYYRETKKILADHRPYLDAVAKALLEKETLLGCDLARIRQTVEG